MRRGCSRLEVGINSPWPPTREAAIAAPALELAPSSDDLVGLKAPHAAPVDLGDLLQRVIRERRLRQRHGPALFDQPSAEIDLPTGRAGAPDRAKGADAVVVEEDLRHATHEALDARCQPHRRARLA